LSTSDKHIILKDLEEELATVMAERNSLSKRQAALEKAVAGVRELISLSGGSLPIPESKPLFSKTAFTNLGIVEGALKYLHLIGKPQTNREVFEALKQGGKTSGSTSFSDTVRATLLRELEKPNSRLRWTGHKWELSEWPASKEEEEEED
jgi:hypothetical protein